MNIRIPWHILGLMAVLAGAIVAAVIELGPPTRSARTSTEVVTAARGVVQSTVTGSGNIEAGTDVEASFQTSGTLQHIYVKDGDRVVKGQLLATLDPTAAQLTLDQAQESLTSAQDNLTNAEAQTTTSGSSTSGSSSSASLNDAQASTEFVAFHPAQTITTQTTTSSTTATTPGRTIPTQTSTATTPSTTTTRSRTTPSQTASGGGSGGGSGASSRSSTSSSSSGSGQTSTTSAETIAANIASAQAAVDGAEATVTNAENALHQTHLYAPATGTVVNVAAVSPGDAVSGSGSGSSSSSGSSSNSGSSSGSGSGSTSGSLNASSSSSSSSSSSGLVEIVNTGSMTMTVSFSESDISKIKAGQRANVTPEALSGVELSAHVSSVSTLGTSSSGVVSYDATLTVDQHDSRVKPGMSASAAVVTGQASGVNLPNSAVTTTGSVARVNVLRNGRSVPTTVVVGLVGDSRTQIVSGLSAGDQVQVTTTLPALGSGSAQSSSGSSGTLGGSGGLGGAGRFLGGGGGLAGGGGRFLGGASRGGG
ncbi:MAG TPA: biotin/lipoyl-binding protein [Solirubrobacteraceae bacterium]